MRYSKAYQDQLELDLAKGGTPEEMTACANDFNAVETPIWPGSERFRRWAMGTAHVCLECGWRFEIEIPPHPNAEVVCPSCTLKR